jgi:hypothetical protein
MAEEIAKKMEKMIGKDIGKEMRGKRKRELGF